MFIEIEGVVWRIMSHIISNTLAVALIRVQFDVHPRVKLKQSDL